MPTKVSGASTQLQRGLRSTGLPHPAGAGTGAPVHATASKVLDSRTDRLLDRQPASSPATFLFLFQGYYFEIPSIGAIRINTQVRQVLAGTVQAGSAALGGVPCLGVCSGSPSPTAESPKAGSECDSELGSQAEPSTRPRAIEISNSSSAAPHGPAAF